jgi:hypothetical protein
LGCRTVVTLLLRDCLQTFRWLRQEARLAEGKPKQIPQL